MQSGLEGKNQEAQGKNKEEMLETHYGNLERIRKMMNDRKNGS